MFSSLLRSTKQLAGVYIILTGHEKKAEKTSEKQRILEQEVEGGLKSMQHTNSKNVIKNEKKNDIKKSQRKRKIRSKHCIEVQH